MEEPQKGAIPREIQRGQSGPLRDGLIEFYDSQASLMLSQYQNIERLLGDTSDWTAPGTHCEILLGNLVRQFLPGNLQTAKGFVYGRLDMGQGPTHSPEIDILIHDTQYVKPIFQMDDFAIVLAEAMHGAIQIKRRMDKNALESGFDNIIHANRHSHWLSTNGMHPSARKYFSALTFFDERNEVRSDGNASDTYRNVFEKMFADEGSWQFAPQVFGSLQRRIYRLYDTGGESLRYHGFPAVHKNKNVAILIFLQMLSNALALPGFSPPFPRVREPDGVVDTIEIMKPNR